MSPSELQEESRAVHPAFPVIGHRGRFVESEWNGINVREHVATQVFAGLLAGPKPLGKRTRASLIPEAIALADELINQLSGD